MKQYEGKELDDKIESFLERKLGSRPTMQHQEDLEDYLRDFSKRLFQPLSLGKLETIGR